METKRYKTAVLIKEIRYQLDLSQEELARELGVSFATVNRWENNRYTPSRLARKQLEAYCQQMIESGRLLLEDG